jgi:hypothetical protein
MRQFMRLLALVAGVVVLSMFVASSTVAANGGSASAFFIGQKTCAQHATSPFFTCVVSASNLPVLQNATVAYISDPAIFNDTPKRIDSDVVLTTADGTSMANGHCTFYFSTGTGLCTYQHGTHALAGFRAVFVVGPVVPHVFSVIGRYSIGGNDD